MNSSIDQLELLKNNISLRITGIKGRRLYYKKHSFYTFISTAILATVTTIILGLNLDGRWKEAARISALIITTIITLINTYNAFFNHKELWIANNNALNKLYQLSFDIEYFEKGTLPLNMAEIDGFKIRYQAILDELNQTWYKSRARSSHSEVPEQ